MASSHSQTVNTTDRLRDLRKLMGQKENAVHALVVPSEDQHSSEYLAECDERRAFISGFNGSAGCAIITLDGAYMFTDGRYFLQAEKQLDNNWTLMKQGLKDVPTWQEFLAKQDGARIGIDATLISAAESKSLQGSLKPHGCELIPLKDNLVDKVWAGKKPLRPQNKIKPLDLKYAGQPSEDKIRTIREKMAKEHAKALVVSMLDEVAWLFNLRGTDIEFNPVFFAYAIVTESTTCLFVNQSQLGDDVLGHLHSEVEIHSYDTFFDYLQGLSNSLGLSKNTPAMIGDKSSLAVAEAIGHDSVLICRSPVAELKAIKNATEIEGFRQCHIRDGAALARYFAWLQEELEKGVELNESQAADKLESFRSELDLFQGLSFTTISSTGPNGAIIHYSPNPKDCAIVKKDQMYLCDSGAQFLDGTTDVTRTWHFGAPTAEEKRAFTRVLQGHIAIDTVVFPNGTTGYLLDPFARKALWEDGLDYMHGTGHGVGHFLNVHEGPQGIGTRVAYNNTALKAGMTVSNEPGYYADGRFGIRIENIVIVKEANTLHNFKDKGFLGFEHVTLCPIHKKLVDVELLTAQERQWLDSYHKETLEKVGPLLKEDDRALKWLERECSPL